MKKEDLVYKNQCFKNETVPFILRSNLILYSSQKLTNFVLTNSISYVSIPKVNPTSYLKKVNFTYVTDFTFNNSTYLKPIQSSVIYQFNNQTHK